MSKRCCYVGRMIMKDIRIPDGRLVNLVDDKLGIVGMSPVFDKKSACEKYCRSGAVELVVRSVNIQKPVKESK